jgi:hypothetical protein
MQIMIIFNNMKHNIGPHMDVHAAVWIDALILLTLPRYTQVYTNACYTPGVCRATAILSIPPVCYT